MFSWFRRIRQKERPQGWPERTVTVPGYGWKVNFRDPSEGEVSAIVASGMSLEKQRRALISMVTSWDVADARRKRLPVAARSFQRLPPVVRLTLFRAITSGEDDGSPKASAEGSSSLPISTPEPEAKQ